MFSSVLLCHVLVIERGNNKSEALNRRYREAFCSPTLLSKCFYDFIVNPGDITF